MARAILIVEDDEDIREIFRELLEDASDCTVHTARNGQEALAMLQRIEQPCLILLDLMMPEMSGWDVLRALREDDALAAVPVVVVSAAPGDTPEGAVRLLRKPVSLETIVSLVRDFC